MKGLAIIEDLSTVKNGECFEAIAAVWGWLEKKGEGSTAFFAASLALFASFDGSFCLFKFQGFSYNSYLSQALCFFHLSLPELRPEPVRDGR
jgi:hypothetical protein